MKQELDQKLLDRFSWLRRPELHREKLYEFVKGFSLYDNYGFEVGDGWYQLLFDLCVRIEEIYKEYDRPVTIKVAQVKAKFGQLRFYYDLPRREVGIQAFDFIGSGSIRIYPEDEADSLENKIAEYVRAAESKSTTICEQCGSENAELCNEPPLFRWISTLCTDCKQARIALYNKKLEEWERFKEEMLKKKADYTD